ncbi:hypothetical protein AJ80_00604 [Polytolypa hystricis UAMH7299]|uniref:Uncharacterized protein n=1 Tax=Polytolypa hystricis (strain UAMH7299) TaxID=1447883 RepID=A0A2B7Z1K6_POLH7|nr:hypothetical protein AJ80_00604 [Polytolypa hystricis UAMH7299]
MAPNQLDGPSPYRPAPLALSAELTPPSGSIVFDTLPARQFTGTQQPFTSAAHAETDQKSSSITRAALCATTTLAAIARRSSAER